MRYIAVVALLAIPHFARADDKPKLAIELTGPKEMYPDEQFAPKAVIHNDGNADVYIVRAIDGSFDNLRSVVSYKWIVKKNGQAVSRRTDVVRIDGHVNGLRPDDVILVKKGKSADPGANGFGNFASYYNIETPGKYTISLSYELTPNGFEKGDANALKLAQSQAAVRVESKPIEVTVLPFPPAIAAAADKVKLAEAKLQIVQQFAETVAKNNNSTAEERDAAAERLKRARAVLDDLTADHAGKMTEFKKKRDEERKKK